MNELLDTVERAKALTLKGTEPADLEFPIDEYGLRYGRAQALMEQLGLDALVLAQPTSVHYYTGLQTWLWMLPPLLPAVAILPRQSDDATLVNTSMERGGIAGTSWIPNPLLYGGADDPLEVIARALRDRGLDRGVLGFELGRGQKPHMSPNDLQRLLSLLPHAQVRDAGPLLSCVRMIKSSLEIDMLKEACRLAQIGFRSALDALRVGVTDAELTRVAAIAMLQAGAQLTVDPIVLVFVGGPNRYRQLVQPSTENAILAGNQVLLDGGCIWHGYHCDFMRSGVIGRLPETSQRYYDVAVLALEAAVQAVGPGVPLGEASRVVADVFRQNRIPVADIPYELGHSIGLDQWELPLITATGESAPVTARPGMVFSLEPTIVGPDGDDDWRAGLFIVEDQIAITSTGVEVLTADLPRAIHYA